MTRKMKDSGVEWIGEIPEEWKATKYKYILEESKNSVRVGPFGSQLKGDDFKEYGYKVFNQRSVLDDNFYEVDTFINKKKFEDLIAFKVNAGDILITTRGTIGKIAVAPKDVEEGIIHPCIIKSVPNLKKININFLKYIFNETDITLEQFILDSNATTIPVIYSEPLKNVYLSLPPLKEQKKIADYLDNKCAKIDQTVEKEKVVIEKLKEYKQSVITEAVTKGLNPDVKMKDSGVEWIGEIPEHWNVFRGKNVLMLLKRPVQDDCEVITCFRDGQVTLRSNRREDGFTFSDKEIGYQGILKGDLVIHGMDGFAGAIGISDSDGKGSPVLNVCQSKGNSFLIYIQYYLRILASQNVFLALATGIRERSCDLRWNKIANLEFIVPPMQEQQEISIFLDKKCSAIDKLITNKEKVIEKLTEYKKSLIYECVTGKREV